MEGWKDISVSVIGVDRGIRAGCASGATCRLYQGWGYTPYLDVVSQGGYGGSEVAFGGRPMGRTSDVFEVKLGNLHCDVDVPANEAGTADGGGYGTAFCTAPQLVPGRHNLTMRVDDSFNGWGAPQFRRGAKQVDLVTGTVFHYTASPFVAGASTHLSGVGGLSSLVIRGSGFASRAEDNVVTVAGVPCTVESVNEDQTELTCLLDEFSFPETNGSAPFAANATQTIPAGRGLLHKVWRNTQSLSTNVFNPAFGRYPNGFDDIRVNLDATRGFRRDYLDYYGQEQTAFFVPPFSTNYSFYIMGDDWTTVELSTDENPANLRSVAWSSGYTWSYFQTATQISRQYELVAGQRYFFRVRHYEWGGGDWFTLGLRIHGLPADSVPANVKVFSSTYEKQVLRLSTNVRRETQIVRVLGVVGGRFQLWVPGNGTGRFVRSRELNWNADTSSFTEALRDVMSTSSEYSNTYPGKSCNWFSVSRVAASDASLATGFEWRFSINCPVETPYPQIQVSPAPSGLVRQGNGTNLTLFSNRTILASAPARGTFRLRVGGNVTDEEGWTADMPYDAGWNVVEAELEKLPGISDVAVRRDGSTWDGASWTITFFSPIGDVPTILADASLLTGENATMFTLMQEHGNESEPFLDPIPAEFFELPLTVPRGGQSAVFGSREFTGAIRVVSNGALAACGVDQFNYTYQATRDPLDTSDRDAAWRACSFTFSESVTPTVTAVSSTAVTEGTEITVTGTNFLPDSVPSTRRRDRRMRDTAGHVRLLAGEEDVLDVDRFNHVLIGGTRCNVSQATSTSLTCRVGHTWAGEHSVVVEVGHGRGLAVNAPDVPRVTFSARVDSVSPVEGSTAGGTRVEIRGTGFSRSSSVVTIGGEACEVLEADYDRIVCRSPAGSSASAAIVVEGITATQTFAFRASRTPLLSSVNPLVLSTAVTGELTLGVSMVDGLTARDVEVRMGSRTCAVKSVESSTVVCTLVRAAPGPLPHNPVTPQVYVRNLGYAAPDTNVAAELLAVDTSLRVDAVSPAVGSLKGGLSVTITGHGFDAAVRRNKNVVTFVSNVTTTAGANFLVRMPCTITDSQHGSITCTTSAFIFPEGIDATDFANPNGIEAEVEVAVSSFIAPGAVVFAYALDRTPIVTGSSFNATSRILTLTGSDLVAGATTVTIREKECAVLSNSGSELTCSVADDRAGTLPIVVHVDGWGLADHTEVFTHVFWASEGLSRDRGSIEGGQELTLEGYGFNADVPTANEVYFEILVSGTTARFLAPIVSASYRELRFLTPENAAKGSANVSASVIVQVWREAAIPGVERSVAADQLANASLPNTTYTFDPSAGYVPTITSLRPSVVVRGTTLTIVGSNFNLTMPEGSSVSLGDAPCDVTFWSNTTINCTIGDAYAGVHRARVTVGDKGLARRSSPQTHVTVNATVSGGENLVTGVEGGRIITLTGAGFSTVASENAPGSKPVLVRVCNETCVVTSSSYASLQCRAPQVNTISSLNRFHNVEPAVLRGAAVTGVGSSTSMYQRAFDGNVETTVDIGNSMCSVGLDFGPEAFALITRIRYYPRFRFASRMRWGFFEASTDGVSWTTLSILSGRVQEGWNYADLISNPAPNSEDSPQDWSLVPQWRFVRYRGPSGGNCNVNEIEIVGIKVTTRADGVCPITVTFPVGTSVTAGTSATAGTALSSVPAQVTYDLDATPTVTSITPNNGTALGGTTLTIRGTGFDGVAAADVSVVLNGVPCAVTTVAATAVTCVTGARDTIRATSVVVDVRTKGRALVNEVNTYFRYLDRWSERTTWAGEDPPVEGDTVVIPEGQAVLLDVSPPRLFLVVIQGELIFDRKDLTFDATYIFVHGGRFEIGTEGEPFLNKVTITLHGDRWETISLPDFGSKVLAVMDRNGGRHSSANRGQVVPLRDHGTIDIHGIPRRRTWCKLAQDSPAGSNTITMSEDVDWAVGDQLVISSSSVDFEQTEEIEVAEVLGPRTLRLRRPLTFAHRAQIFAAGQYGHSDADMRAAVGLLSRNIVIQGDEGSARQLFGAHTMAVGGGTYRIENTEFRRCGQGFFMGRYCTHVHMVGAGGVRSYVKANSVHHSFQRAFTIHGTSYYEVKHNVAYNIRGHSLFVEDGAERYNVIEENLILYTLRSFASLKGDLKPASFWTSSPRNFWRNNYAAGCTNDGFWFELPGNPHGPSYSTEVCPVRESVGEFFNNTASSNGVHGLRIYPVYLPHVDPCDEYSAPDPQYYHNFTSFRNGQHGIFGKENGDLHHINAKLLENNDHEIKWLKLKHVKYTEDPHLKNLLAVARTDGTLRYTKHGVFAPQDEFFYIDGATFVNYGGSAGAMAACAECDAQNQLKQGGYTVRVRNLRFFNSEARVKWTPPFNQIFWDLDGSLTGVSGGWATPFRAMNAWPECPRRNAELDFGLACDNTVKVRRLQIDGVNPRELDFQSVWFATTVGVDETRFQPKEHYGWTTPVVSTHWYHGFFRNFIDYQTMRIRYSEPAYVTSDPSDWVGMTFNYTDYRDRNEVFYGVGSSAVDQRYAITPENASSTFGFNLGDVGIPRPTDPIGTGYLNQSTNVWYVMLNNVSANVPLSEHWWDENRYRTHRIDVTRKQCPISGCPRPPAVQLGVAKPWSDPTAWPMGRLPVAGENITINASTHILMDINPPKLGLLTIEGKLEFVDTADRELHCDKILVWGALEIGTPAQPFTRSAQIVLYGRREVKSDSVVVDDSQNLGKKVIAVYGNFTLHGRVRDRTWTKLARTAEAGSSQILLARPALSWRPGDRLVLTPTEYGPSQLEDVTIQSISADGRTVTLTAPLLYRHFAGNVSTGAPGQDVILAGAVGLLSHNVVVRSFLDGDDLTFGGHIVVSEVPGQGDTVRAGVMDARFVEFRDLGQGEKEHAGIDFLFSISNVGDNPVQRIQSCAFSNSKNYGVVAAGTRHLYMEHNVIHRATRTAVDVDRNSLDLVLRFNLVAGVFRTPSDSHHWIEPRAGFYINVRPTEIRGNVVGGSYDTGYTLRPTACLVPSASVEDDPIVDNEAHAVMIGVFLLSTPGSRESWCRQLTRFTVWKASHLGIFTIDQTAHMRLDNVTVSDSHIGVSLNFFRMGTRTSYVYMDNSRILGSTAASTCDASVDCRAMSETDTAGLACNSVLRSEFRRAGFLSTQYLNRGKTCEHDPEMPVCRPPSRPERLCGFPWEKRYGLPGTRHAHTFIRNTVFAHFSGDDDCGAKSRAVVHNPTQVDYAPPMTFEGLRWFNTSREGRFWFGMNELTDGKCVSSGCDGFNHIMIEDKDGTTVSSGRPRSFITGFNPEIVAPEPVCTPRSEWYGIECDGTAPDGDGIVLRGAIMENMDRDRGFRRVGPARISRETPGGELRNSSTIGPLDDSCPMRFFFGQFPFSLEVNKTSQVRFAGTLPANFRSHFHSTDPSEGVVVALFIERPNALDLFVNGRRITMNNDTRMPTVSDPAGTYLFNPQRRTLWFVMRGGDPGTTYDIVRTPAVQLNMTLAVSPEEFYGPNLIANMAVLLSIPANRIRIVSVEAGSTTVEVEVVDSEPTTMNTTATAQQALRLVELVNVVREAAENRVLNEAIGYPVENLAVALALPALKPPPQAGNTTDVADAEEDPTVDTAFIDAVLSQLASSGLIPSDEQIASGVPTTGGGSGTTGGIVIAIPSASPTPSVTPSASPSAAAAQAPEEDELPIPLIVGVVVGSILAALVVTGIVVGYRRMAAAPSKKAELNTKPPAPTGAATPTAASPGGPEVEWFGNNPVARPGVTENPSGRTVVRIAPPPQHLRR